MPEQRWVLRCLRSESVTGWLSEEQQWIGPLTNTVCLATFRIISSKVREALKINQVVLVGNKIIEFVLTITNQ